MVSGSGAASEARQTWDYDAPTVPDDTELLKTPPSVYSYGRESRERALATAIASEQA